ELPFPADDVLYDEIDLRPVKSRLTRLFCERNSESLRRGNASRLGAIPLILLADVFRAVGIAQADANTVVLEIQSGEDDFHQLQASKQFLRDLIFGAK